jgi:hypothetical protein
MKLKVDEVVKVVVVSFTSAAGVKVLSFVNVYIDNGCLRKDKHATDD